MKFGKREINLFLGFLSLVAIIVYFFIFYLPQQSVYNEKVQQLETMQSYMIKAKSTVEKIPEMQKTAEKYKEKTNELSQSLPNQIDHLKAMVTIEDVAKENNLDLYSFSESSAISAPTTSTMVCDAPKVKGINENGQNLYLESTHPLFATATPINCFDTVEAATSQGYTLAPADLVLSNTPIPPTTVGVSNTVSYSVTIKGEYRSLITFFYKMQNLNLINEIQNFELVYSNVKESQQGLPLTAKFQIVFKDQNSIPQNPVANNGVNNEGVSQPVPAPAVVEPSAQPVSPVTTSGEPTTASSDASNGSCTIKGNSTTKIYYTPEDPAYNTATTDTTFCSVDEAKSASFRESNR